ncbi:MAG: hypothetical protein GY751_11100 [Bacteroidetes bacterium]|nr:hypothetical protein [Bacteroidota bacterium]
MLQALDRCIDILIAYLSSQSDQLKERHFIKYVTGVYPTDAPVYNGTDVRCLSNNCKLRSLVGIHKCIKHIDSKSIAQVTQFNDRKNNITSVESYLEWASLNLRIDTIIKVLEFGYLSIGYCESLEDMHSNQVFEDPCNFTDSMIQAIELITSIQAVTPKLICGHLMPRTDRVCTRATGGGRCKTHEKSTTVIKSEKKATHKTYDKYVQYVESSESEESPKSCEDH